MRLTIKLISDTTEFSVDDQTGKTLEDYYQELIDTNSAFIKIGHRILQKATIEYINAE